MLFFFLACADSDGKLSSDQLAADLWAEMDNFESWEQAEPWVGIQPSADGTHGPFVEIWLNPEAMASIADAEAAEGSILVKRAYDDADGGGARASVTTMWKVGEADAPETGWYWAAFDAAGVASNTGEPAGCTGCHAAGSDSRRIVTDIPGGA